MPFTTSVASGPYIATGVAQSFPFDFTPASASEVQVLVNGVVVPVGSYSVVLTSGGGTVSATITAGASVTLLLNPDFGQASEFQAEGAYNLPTVNTINKRHASRALWLRNALFDNAGIAGRLAPLLSLLLKPTLKGDPGGNVMAIGPFTALSGLDVQGTNSVTTDTYDAPGDGGGARYDFLPGRGLEGQVATRATVADGRVFGLSLGTGVSLAATGKEENYAARLQHAFDAFDFAGRSSPVGGYAGYGLGRVVVPRGKFAWSSTFAPYAALGFSVQGQGRYASAFTCTISGGVACTLTGYNSVHLADFTVNMADDVRYSINSVFLNLVSTGGGGFVTVKRVQAEGYDTVFKNSFTTDGDKTLIEQGLFAGNRLYDQGANRQAIGWVFFSNAGTTFKTNYLLSGAGMTTVISDVFDVRGSYIKYPNGSGNPNLSHADPYWAGGMTIISTKLELHSGGLNTDGTNMVLVDASGSTGNGVDNDGSNTDLTLIDVHATASTDSIADPDNHDAIRIGGANPVRVKQWGGWIRGVIRLTSGYAGRTYHRLSFERAVKAPLPEKLVMTGAGNHPLIEWRANENVPVDQYRGGQSHVGSIDAQKAFLWRHAGNKAIDTTIATTDFGGGNIGGNFTIGGFPPGLTVTGLALLVTDDGGTQTGVGWYSDAAFTAALGGAGIPGGSKGLKPVVMNDATKWFTVGADGNVFVRLAKPELTQVTRGALVIFYFPYGGA